MKITICDDKITEGAVTKDILIREKFGTEDNIEIISPNELLVAVEEKVIESDILIMDIEFDDEQYDGIHLAKVVNEHLPMCQIIYLSNHIDYAPEVYETEHCYFVVKKNADVMLKRAMKKAVSMLEKSEKQEYITVAVNGKKNSISVSDVIYIEKNQRKATVYTSDASMECYQSLRSMTKKDSELVRCHGSYVVNLKHISRVCTDEIVMDSGVVVPIGRNYHSNIKDRYLEFWSSGI